MTGPDGAAEVAAVSDRLGVRLLVVPPDEPPMRFGTCAWTDTGDAATPGALSMTWIETGGDADAAEVEDRGAEVVADLAAAPGFLAFLGTTVGARGHTVTAWTSVAAAEAAVGSSAAHRAALHRFRHGALGRRGFTSLWVPHRLNPQYARCPRCDAPVRVPAGAAVARCACGGAAEPAAYL